MVRAWTPQQSARIAGAAYLITNVTSEFNLFYAVPRLIAGGDIVRTAINVRAHPQLLGVMIVMEVLTIAGCVILNVALYELLATVHRSYARLAAFWRLIEQAVYAATGVFTFALLLMLSKSEFVLAFEPRQLQALARLFRVARSEGFFISMAFLCLGSGIYFWLLAKSRYIPRALANSGLAAAVLGVLGIFTYFVFPQFITASFAAIRALPAAAQALLGIIVAPIVTFEITIGLWLLVKGVNLQEQT